MTEEFPVKVAVEGPLDLTVVKRLLESVGGVVDVPYVCKGKSDLQNRVLGFNEAARREPWFVLVDLDRDADCAPRLIPKVADRSGLAKFLRVRTGDVPGDPEGIDDAKAHMVALG